MINETYALMMDLNEKIYNDNEGMSFYTLFGFYSDGGNECIDLWIDGLEIRCLDDSSDRGWDEEAGDYERTEKEQVIYELKLVIDRINDVIKAIDN